MQRLMNLNTTVNAWKNRVWSAPLAPAPRDRRAYTRAQVSFEGWLDCGGKRLKIRGRNLDRGGAMVLAKEPAAVDSRAFLYIETYQLLGWATVRWCASSGLAYRIGMEFRSPLMRADFGIWQFSAVPVSSLEI